MFLDALLFYEFVPSGNQNLMIENEVKGIRMTCVISFGFLRLVFVSFFPIALW